MTPSHFEQFVLLRKRGVVCVFYKGQTYELRLSGYRINDNPAAFKDFPKEVLYWMAEDAVGEAPF